MVLEHNKKCEKATQKSDLETLHLLCTFHQKFPDPGLM